MTAESSRHELNAAMLRRARLRLLKMHFDSGVGHIGGNLSAIDTVMCLHHNVMTGDDAFVLSKGHAAGALYITLWSMGLLSEEELLSFHKDNTRLPGHPPARGIEAIPFATGSLGHGVGLAAGMAMGKRLRKKPGRVFCLTSDGEWNEGSCWESLIFLAHRQMDLTLIVDANGLQGFGTCREVANLDSLAKRFRAFGVSTDEIDGHDPAALTAALRQGPGLRAIVARTVKGRGVSFMENRVEWHYLPMKAEQYQQAVAEVQKEAGDAQ